MWKCTCGATNQDGQTACSRCQRPRQENPSAAAKPATEGARTMTSRASTGSRSRPASGAGKRRGGGRERPYRALRFLAKLYIILAPVVLALMLLVSLAGLAREAPLTEKVGSSLGLIVLGGMYYLLMKSVGQAIYILFDIAGNTRMVREAVEISQAQGG